MEINHELISEPIVRFSNSDTIEESEVNFRNPTILNKCLEAVFKSIPDFEEL